MNVGRELDALIAEKVMGWARYTESWYDEEGVDGTRFVSPDGVTAECYGWGNECNYDDLGDELPHYSTDIATAWQVVEQLQTSSMRVVIIAYLDGTYACEIRGRGTEFITAAPAATAPLAICLAALKAVGMEL